MKSISFTFAPFALCLVSCAQNQPAASISSTSGGGKYASREMTASVSGSNSSSSAHYGAGSQQSKSGSQQFAYENSATRGISASAVADKRAGSNASGGYSNPPSDSSLARNGRSSQQQNSESQQLVYEKSTARGSNGSGGVSNGGGSVRDAANSAGAKQVSGGNSVVGSWSGNDGQQRISVKFGANGSLIINNAAGANPGQWNGGSGGKFRIQVGSYNGEFVMVDSRTGSLTLGDSSVELKR